jgi:hypothetical protein
VYEVNAKAAQIVSLEILSPVDNCGILTSEFGGLLLVEGPVSGTGNVVWSMLGR